MKEIALSQGKVAIVDDDMFDELSKHKWCCSSRGYAVRHSSCHFGKSKIIWMHREILQTLNGMETDHINGKRLDNRHDNLRVCTHAENSRNIRKRACNTTGYKGLSWFRLRRKWRVTIKVNTKQVHLGYFDDKQAAARAYDKAALEHFGQFAQLNFAIESETNRVVAAMLAPER